MHWIDWTIVAVFLGIAVVTVLVTKRQMKSVADFLAGGRCAGRYMLTVSSVAAGTAAISIVVNWESTYRAGYGAMWWGNLLAPIYLILSLSGWAIYRYRQTRALTMAQFFELRYSRRFRVFAGVLAYVSGVINYGIFPSVGARFLIYFCRIPEPYHVQVLGVDVSLTYAAVLLFLVGFALFLTLNGGQIAIMVSDFIEGMLLLIAGAVIAIRCLSHFSWDQLGVAFQNAADPVKASMINPFKTSNVKDFNFWYYIILAFSAFYNAMAWQGASGYAAAPKNPHEGRMAGVVARWRGGALAVIISFLAICAFTVMHNPEFSGVARSVQTELNTISNPAYQSQATVPFVLNRILPVGLMGLLCAVMVAGAVTTDETPTCIPGARSSSRTCSCRFANVP